MTIGSINDLSRLPGMPSVPTLRGLIARHRDFPIVRRGWSGRAYRIDLEAAVIFVTGLSKPAPISGPYRDQMIAELGLEMLANCRDGGRTEEDKPHG